MIYSIENSTVKITASTHGGELHSITGKETGTEYLWNGNAEYWKYHAPHLFPIIGKTVDLKYRVDGNTYELPSHGLARISEYTLLSQTENSLTFELKYSDELLKVYPYKFSLQITYTIGENSVNVGYKVINLDSKEIFFSIGAHPAFMCPINQEEKLEDCYLEFNQKENSSVMLITEEGYLSHNRKECLKDENIINLPKELFEDDALVFDNLKSDKITIKSRKSSKELAVEFKGFTYMGIWAPKAGAPFLCIEPWFGHADYEDFKGELKEKEGGLSLEPSKEFKCNYKVSFK